MAQLEPAPKPGMLSRVASQFTSFFQRQQTIRDLADNENNEPRGSIPEQVKGRISGWGEPGNISRILTIERIQNAISMAERGDVRDLFTAYRDLICNSAHIQTEWGKRKMVVIGQPHSVTPINAGNPEDIKAATAVEEMIESCENWTDGVIHLLDSSLYPVSAVEKIFAPKIENGINAQNIKLRYYLKRLEPVNYALFCFKLPYLAPGGFGTGNMAYSIPPNFIPVSPVPSGNSAPINTIWNPDTWEPNLRFYNVFENGYVDYSYGNIYAPDPMRHIVHRGNTMSGIRDNFGGPMRSVMWWWYLSTCGRDWYSRNMERYGSPWPVAYVNSSQKDTMAAIAEAFSLATKIGGLIVDSKAKIELLQAVSNDASTAYEKFLNFCNREISKLIVGQELSSTAKSTGMGSGVADLQSEVRDDIRQFDQAMLCNTLKRQLFEPFLRINGLTGAAPNITWGGVGEEELESIGRALYSLSMAGLEMDDSAVNIISQRVGFELKRREIPTGETQQNGQPTSTGGGQSRQATRPVQIKG